MAERRSAPQGAGVVATKAKDAVGPTAPIALPAINTPLKEIYAELRTQAVAGNAQAACRLSFELDRCASLPSRREGLAKSEKLFAAKLQGEANARRRAFAEESLNFARRELEVSGAACAGFIPDKDERQPWEYLLAAAHAGHEPSAVRYISAASMGLDMDRPLQTFEGWNIYRTEAPLIAERSIQAGSPEAYQWVAFTSVAGWYGMSLTPRDPIRGAALYLALRDRAAPAYATQLDGNINALVQREGLTPEDMAKARALSTGLARQLKTPANGVDFSQGTFPSEDGSHCSR